MMNPMKTLKNHYDSWLTQNAKWLPSTPAEITIISQWAQYWQYTPHTPARNVRKLCYFVTGTYRKSRCHHHQIGMDYLYDAIFKMVESEMKLRFLILILCYCGDMPVHECWLQLYQEYTSDEMPVRCLR